MDARVKPAHDGGGGARRWWPRLAGSAGRAGVGGDGVDAEGRRAEDQGDVGRSAGAEVLGVGAVGGA